MKISYDYEEMIQELKEDVRDATAALSACHDAFEVNLRSIISNSGVFRKHGYTTNRIKCTFLRVF